ncbi:MAG TPA: hypothetical protein VLN25_05495, partial [Burkholderiaceae bacterium]|nr:hypothetical protein [Burkholderiaceae bacterium]
GSWLPGEILVNENFRGNLGKTMPTLVHEAAHGVWKADHPRAKGVPEPSDEGGENEYHCVLQELIIYRWMRDTLNLAQPDFELDTRVDRLENGTLKSSIINAHKDELMRNSPAPRFSWTLI